MLIRTYLTLSRLGARLGNWNDRVNATGDRSAENPRRWHVIDRVSSRLYVLGDRADRLTADRAARLTERT